MKGKRKTLNASDVLSAMEEMEFQRFVTPLKEALEGNCVFVFLNIQVDVHPKWPAHLGPEILSTWVSFLQSPVASIGCDSNGRHHLIICLVMLGRLFFLLYLSFSSYPVDLAAAVCLVQPCFLTAYRREQKGKKEASEQKKKDKDKKTDSEEQDKSRDEDNDEDEERLEEEEQNEEEEVDNWGEWGDAPWKEPRENLVHVCVKLFPAGQSSLRQKSLRRLK